VTGGEFNGDGKLDLAVANTYDGSVLVGKGDGTFSRRSTTPRVPIHHR
jgi:autotransporter-associated beta strand protein